MTKRDFSFRLRYRDELRRAVESLAANPAASESISTPNGGSRTVSYTQLSALAAELRQVEAEINAYKRSIHRGYTVETNYARWC